MQISFYIPKNLYPYLVKRANENKLSPNVMARRLVEQVLHDDVYKEAQAVFDEPTN